ncbi:hypothetical protein HZI73_04875 [Vallitalea pronyensis]|uniref:SLH domain-containing protein n=1 Tax=Vallitalea pronyensis TaxID=1348613 RepID=A0A8J8MHR0_9FIRM|nr:hypothetical protein [Vallitalea pronyensis]QUI21667.1 hypothetical protein HZI73_04875 [Vallitalea pronyensis]
MKKKYLKMFVSLALVMVLGITSYAGDWDVSTAHTWAQPEIEEAYAYDLMPDRLMDVNLSDQITRAQFAALVVKMYETMTGESVNEAPANTFTDSNDTDVLKANTLGIMKGSSGKANPGNLVTRQEMAAMYYRTLVKVYGYFGEEIKATDGILTTNDKSLVANWFIKEVDYINENNIMNGSNGNFNPLDNAGIEQAIVVVKRVYQDELDLIKGTRKIDLSKGYTYAADSYGKYFTVTYTANGKSNTIKANEYTSLKVISNDKDNKKIYYTENHDDAIDENGVKNYSYNVATNEATCLDEYLGYKVSNAVLIESSQYKGYLLVYPLGDSVNVYSHDLELVCTLEGMVTTDNANTMIHNKLNEPDDYKQGYTINDDGQGNISVTFNNTGNTKVIMAPNKTHMSNGRKAKALNDYSKIFFLADTYEFISENVVSYYDFEDDRYKQLGARQKDKMDFKIIQYKSSETNEILEYVVVDTNKSTYDVYTDDGEFFTNKVYAFDDTTINANIDAYLNRDFKIVADGKIIADNKFNYAYTYTLGKEWISSDDYVIALKDKGGPTFYTRDLYRYQDDAVYECDMEILSDEEDNGNSGIVFNVQSISKGNDNYRGYYVGIDLYKDTLIFGKADYNWQSLKEVNISNYSIKKGDRFTLKVVKTGRNINVFIDDLHVLHTSDSSYPYGGAFGLRSWNADCKYYSITASPSN